MEESSVVTDDNLYALLNVKQDATDREITLAYRRQALLHHPDKSATTSSLNSFSSSYASFEERDRFTRINRAYNVLSHPGKRRLYDTYGNVALDLLDHFGDDSVEMVEVMLNPMKSVMSICLLGVLILCFLLGLILLQCKWDLWIQWSWFLIMAPLFSIQVLVCLLVSMMLLSEALLASRSNQREGEPRNTGMFSGSLALGVWVYSIQIVLFTLQAEQVINRPWWQLVQPCFIYETLLLAHSLYFSNPNSEAFSSLTTFGKLFIVNRWNWLRLFQICLFALYKAIGSWTLHLAFLPAYLAISMPILDHLLLSRQASPAASSSSEKDKEENGSRTMPKAVLYLLLYPGYTVLTAHLKLAIDPLLNKKNFLYRWLVVFMPTYLILALILVVIGVSIVGLLLYREALVKLVTSLGGNQRMHPSRLIQQQ